MTWNNKKVLITGAGGFIGSHLAERLVKEGAHVRAFVRYNSRGDAGLLKWLPHNESSRLELMAGDLRDSEAVRQAVAGVDTIFHLAALIGIPYSYIHPVEVVETNVMGTLNVLSAARDEGVRRMVHTSTSEVYGTAQYVPIDEKHPLQGQSPYSAAKIGADKLAESFHRAFGLPVVTVRPFNVYGPRQSARAVIPAIISQALTREEVLLGNLSPERDFTFVSDVIEGFLAAAFADGIAGQEINLGTGSALSIEALTRKIFDLMGKHPNIVKQTERRRPDNSEVMKLLSANEKARRVMGWSPRIALEEGLRRTIQWISDHLDFYDPSRYSV